MSAPSDPDRLDDVALRIGLRALALVAVRGPRARATVVRAVESSSKLLEQARTLRAERAALEAILDRGLSGSR